MRQLRTLVCRNAQSDMYAVIDIVDVSMVLKLPRCQEVSLNCARSVTRFGDCCTIENLKYKARASALNPQSVYTTPQSATEHSVATGAGEPIRALKEQQHRQETQVDSYLGVREMCYNESGTTHVQYHPSASKQERPAWMVVSST